jgi:integrase
MTETSSAAGVPRPAWNKGKITGPKPPLRPSHVWAIRAKLDLEKPTRNLAMFDRDCLDPSRFATHSMRRTKATLIYRRTGNLRAVQLLLDHSKIESTVRCLVVEVDDAPEIAEKVDVERFVRSEMAH